MGEIPGWEQFAIEQRNREQSKPQCAECQRLREIIRHLCLLCDEVLPDNTPEFMDYFEEEIASYRQQGGIKCRDQ